MPKTHIILPEPNSICRECVLAARRPCEITI
jgi:hypothetical protein